MLRNLIGFFKTQNPTTQPPKTSFYMHIIDPDHHLSLADVFSALHKPTTLSLSTNATHKIEKCRTYLDKKINQTDALVYGINTGFGSLCNVAINKADLEQLQANLLMSHAAGAGAEVPQEIVRLMLFLKIQSLSYGHSGVQVLTVQRLVDFYNLNILPVIYTQGSLGASGDLAPLAHLALPLIGLGEVWQNGEKVPASKVLEAHKLSPITLQSKEGLALINGTQFMSAYGVYNLYEAYRAMNQANMIAALSIDAFDARPQPFMPHSHIIRKQNGQIQVAKTINEWLEGSEIFAQHKTAVQDPYSFRCIPQVHGATHDVLAHVSQIFENEINAVTDNPNIFPDEDLILSAGNFHGQPLAMALDYLSIAISELGSISERRTYKLISGERHLPAFLVKNPGLNSGLMIAQYTAAGIASENKALCHPASVDSIVSSNGQEDHVSMGAHAAVKCCKLIDNVHTILSIEWLTAVSAMEFTNKSTSKKLQTICNLFVADVSISENDGVLYPKMASAKYFLKNYDSSKK